MELQFSHCCIGWALLIGAYESIKCHLRYSAVLLSPLCQRYRLCALYDVYNILPRVEVLILLCQLTVLCEERGEGALLTGTIREFSCAWWMQQDQVAHLCVRARLDLTSSCTPPPFFQFLSNKAEYLFYPIRFSVLPSRVSSTVVILDGMRDCACARARYSVLFVSSPIPDVQLRLLAC